MIVSLCRPYTRQCLANISVGTVGPTVGGTTTNLRSMRQKREAIDALRDNQDNQESDLQGKPQFYPKLCSKPVMTEQQMRLVVEHPQPAGNETPRANPCQFSTFKSSPVRTALEVSLDFAALNVGGARKQTWNRAELDCSTSHDYTANRVPDRQSTQRSTRSFHHQPDVSYFFQLYKREKEIDFEVMMFDRLTLDEKKAKTDHDEDAVHAASGGSLNCFGGLDKDKSGDHDEKKQKACTVGGRHHASGHDARRDSGNVEFLEKEGEIFKISSSELLQEASAKKKRNFSFNNKEKTHRSLESLERSIDLSAKDSKSLDLFEERSKAFFHGKQRSLDSSQKSKKSMDSSANKARKRPNFFQRVRRSWHFLLMQRRIKRRNKYEYPMRGREKCEYFLYRLLHYKSEMLECASNSSLVGRLQTTELNPELNVLPEQDDADDKGVEPTSNNDQKDEKEVAVLLEDGDRIRVVDDGQNGQLPDENVNDKPPKDKDAEKPSQLVTENNISRKLQEVIGSEKKEHIVDWVATIANLDTLSHATSSNETVSYGMLHGTRGILKGILFDIFLCVCV